MIVKVYMSQTRPATVKPPRLIVIARVGGQMVPCWIGVELQCLFSFFAVYISTIWASIGSRRCCRSQGNGVDPVLDGEMVHAGDARRPLNFVGTSLQQQHKPAAAVLEMD